VRGAFTYTIWIKTKKSEIQVAEWELVEKCVSFFNTLTSKDKWELAAAAGAAVSSVGAIIYKAWSIGKSSIKPAINTTVHTGMSPDDRKSLDDAIAGREKAISETEHAKTELVHINRLKSALSQNDEELWRFHKTPPPHDLLNKIHASGMRVLTFANLKGGVGKTTMAANLAAYFERQGKRVLLIDFDYQGSLSSTVLRAAGKTEVTGLAHLVLAGKIVPAALTSGDRRLDPTLPNLSLVPCNYELHREENRSFFNWLLNSDSSVSDPRFALARLLADDAILSTFQVVIIDTPPRLTLATINALAASTDFAIPTILDALSIENVGSFLKQVKLLFSNELNPHIKLAGMIGTMTAKDELNDTETTSRTALIKNAVEVWGPGAHMIARNVPNTARFHEDAGHTIAYLDHRSTNLKTRQVIEELGAQCSKAIGL
jgi:cellulose biosynthesis protein BcsQ